MLPLAAAALAFTAIHLGISGTTIRDRLTAAIGLNAYMLVFSIASVAAMAALAVTYRTAPYLQLWQAPLWWRHVAIALMLPAFLLVVIGLTTPNPTAAGQEARAATPAAGIVRITRHPFLIGTALWAALHLAARGDLAATLFFGALLIVAAAGAPSIDAKRRRALGPAWDGFARQTSILPFAAILAGRNHLVVSELGWWRIAAGIVAYALMLGGHRHIIGVSPFPW